MAKKKTKKKSSKKKSSGKKSGGMNDFLNFSKLIGMAGGAFGSVQLKKVAAFTKLDPKLQAAIKIGAGEWLPKQSFAKGVIGDDAIRQGAGDALIYEGVKELMAGFGIAGMSGNRKPKGNEFLAVSIEGIEDAGAVSEDILSADEYDIGEDDIDTVNEDILGDDMDGDDDMGEDGMEGDDDISTVNEDILGDDINEDLL